VNDRGDLVGFVFPLRYYPRLEETERRRRRRRRKKTHGEIDQVQRDGPLYYLLNTDSARAESVNSPIGDLIGGLQAGTIGYCAS
jgi:hypothetical protein